MSDPEAVSRWSRAFVLASAGFLVAWGALAVVGTDRRVAVTLGLYGFVLHVVFGKAYSLVPTYFERELAVPAVMPLHLGLTASGVAALALGHAIGARALVRGGSALWLAGVALFVGTLLGTVRGNLSGAATGTGSANADRRGVDRLANAFVPIALAYLLVGSYATAAPALGLPPLVDGYPPRASHLIALGGVVLLLFAVGFRLLPRFLVAHPPRTLVGTALAAGAIAPAVIAAGLGGGAGFGGTGLFAAGAALEATAFAGFAVAFLAMFARSDRDRVGFYGVLGGIVAGAGGIALGLWFAHEGVAYGLVGLHLRLNLLGFLGLTIVGVAYQFYPPAAGTFRGAADRTALASIAAILAGLGVEAAGVLLGAPPLPTLGRALALGGAVLYAGLLIGLFDERYW